MCAYLVVFYQINSMNSDCIYLNLVLGSRGPTQADDLLHEVGFEKGEGYAWAKSTL